MSALLGTLFGRYRLEQSLGRGGMAEVFRATDERLGRAVAVKVILPSFAEQPQFVDRFLREARLVAGLEHPNIVPVYDFGDRDGVPYLVMPFLEGGTLAGRLIGKPLSVQLVCLWVRQLAEALDAAHDQKILHRDVKPGNVLIGKGDRVLLADFGIAKMAESATRLTATGVVVGTPMFMAPELAQGQPASPESDLYALAVMAYEMLIGQAPFVGESALAVMHQHVTTPPPRPSVRRPELTTALDPLFAAALAKDPHDRPKPCAAFAAGLESVLATGERRAVTLASPTELGQLPTRAMSSVERSEAVASPTPRVGGRLAVVLVLVVLSILGWVTFARMRAKPLPPPSVAVTNGEKPAGAPSPAVPAVSAPAALAVPPSAAAPPQLPRSGAEQADAAATNPVGAAGSESETDTSVELSPAEVPQAATDDTTAPSVPSPGRGPLAERLRSRGGAGGRQGGLAGAGGGRAEAPRLFSKRLSIADFERLRDGAGRVERLGNTRGALVRTYAEGGLAYLRGDHAEAQRTLQQLGAAEGSGFTELWPLSLLRKLLGAGEIAAWAVAVSYTDARHEAAGLITAELAARPQNLAARFGKALVEHLDGRHGEAAQTTEALHGLAPRDLAPRVAIYAGEEREHAGDLEEALGWFRAAVSSPVAAEAGVAALHAARVAVELHRTDEARRILETACRAQARLACDRLRELQ
jgi:Protein kinase domain